MKRMSVVLLLIPLLLVGGVTDAFSKRPHSKKKWTMEFSPYFWLAGVSGDIAVEGQRESIDFSASDMRKFKTWSMNLHVEGKKRNLSLLLDFRLTRNAHEEDVTRVEMNSWRLETGAAYHLEYGVEVLGGVRFSDADINLIEEHVSTHSGNANWVDPFIGGRYMYEFVRDWRFLLRGDIGGFGVGSDFSWNAFVGVDYFVVNVAFFVGYRMWGIKYSKGSGDDFFKYDIIQSGLGFGMTFFL